MRIMKMNNSSIVEELKKLNDDISNKIKEEEQYNVWVYSNLRLTLLERVFFGMFAKKQGMSNTKLFRTFINAMMRRNPNMLEDAKKAIDSDDYEKYIRDDKNTKN